MNLIVLTKQFGTYTGATVSTIELLKRISKHFKDVIIITTQANITKLSNVKILIVKNRKEMRSRLSELTERKKWIGYSDDHYGWMLGTAQIPYIHTYHGNWPDARYLSMEMFGKSFYFIPQYRKTVKNAKITVSVSEFMQKRFVDYNTKKSVVIYNGVKQEKSQKVTAKSKKILMVGNVDGRKYGLAVKLFKKYGNDMFPEIDIYGAILDKKIASELKKIPFVNLKGKREFIDYQNYSKFLCTSSSENLPVSIVESILQKVPVISFDVGGVKEVVKKDCGTVVPQYDLFKMTNEILSSKKYTFENLEELKTEFNWDYAATKYMKLFKQLGE